MARELRRLLIPPARLEAAARNGPERAGITLALEPGEVHYLGRVLRLRHGDRLDVIHGEGARWTASLASPALLQLEQPLDQPLERADPPSPAITLAMAVPKRDAELNFQHAARQAYVALGTALIAAAMEGVDSTPMEGFDPAAADEILGLRELGLRSVVLLPLGYRKEEGDWLVNLKKVRRPLEDFVTLID